MKGKKNSSNLKLHYDPRTQIKRALFLKTKRFTGETRARTKGSRDDLLNRTGDMQQPGICVSLSSVGPLKILTNIYLYP